ncbi:MAG: type II secretion system F family protein [Candidatus Peregrinibacteria bacterium]
MAQPNPQKKSIWNIQIGGVSRGDILFLTRHLSIALENGLTLIEALDMLKEESSSAKMQAMLGDMTETVQAGKPFYEALARYPKIFSAVYTNLVKTGELAGSLAENLKYLAEELRKSEDLRQKIKSAMMYPMLIFIAVIGLGISVAWFILPQILPLFKSLEIELPITTRALIIIADALDAHGTLIVSCSIGFIIFMMWLLRQKWVKPVTHPIILKFPVISGIIKNIQLERFMRILSTLLKSGLTLDKSLRIVADASTNLMYQRAIRSFIIEVEKGHSLGEAMAFYQKLFPHISMRMIAMGERTGSLEHTLSFLAQMYQEEVENTMKNLSTILEPLLLIIIGVVVGGVAISILGPIYKITGNLKQ